jgi:DNA-binding MarR family transcriptional regulator
MQLQFLAEYGDQAFTQTEIHDAIGIKRGSVGAALSRLEDRGRGEDPLYLRVSYRGFILSGSVTSRCHFSR